eukprot:Skav210797  [mRNA]  locus=scaffold275:217908:229138:+ [translate_table: standard]
MRMTVQVKEEAEKARRKLEEQGHHGPPWAPMDIMLPKPMIWTDASRSPLAGLDDRHVVQPRYSAQHLSKEQSDTYDLNDPRRLRKVMFIEQQKFERAWRQALELPTGGPCCQAQEMLIEENGDQKYIQETAEMIAAGLSMASPGSE